MGPALPDIELLIARSIRVNPGGKMGRTSEAHLGKQVDNLVDGLFRDEFAMRSPVAFLASTFALGLPALRRVAPPTAFCRSGAITGRQQIRMARVSLKLLDQHFDVPLKLRHSDQALSEVRLALGKSELQRGDSGVGIKRPITGPMPTRHIEL